MNDQTLLISILAVTAIATMVQAVALVTVLMAARRLEARFALAERVAGGQKPRESDD